MPYLLKKFPVLGTLPSDALDYGFLSAKLALTQEPAYTVVVNTKSGNIASRTLRDRVSESSMVSKHDGTFVGLHCPRCANDSRENIASRVHRGASPESASD